MVVNACRGAVIDDKYAARHAKVHDRGTFIRVDQQVLRAPADGLDAATTQLVLDTAGHGPAQPAVANDDIRDGRVDEPGLDAAATGFYFG